MTRTGKTVGDDVLWSALVNHENAFFAARAAFMSGAADRISVLRSALLSVAERGAALRLLKALPVTERQALFEELISLASVGHGDVHLVRAAICSIPVDWTLSRVEAAAEPLLRNGTYEEYRRLLELYIELDPALTRRLAERATRHADADIREAGEDFLARLGA